MVRQSEEPADRVEVVRSARPWWLLAALATLGVVLTLVLTQSDEPVELTETPSSSTSEVRSASTIVAAPDPTPSDELIVASTALPVRAVVSTPIGLGPRLITWLPGGSVEERDLPALFDYAFDSSGRWLAALDRGLGTDNPVVPEPAALWVGPVDGELRLVAEEVIAFSWHDANPALLAWQTGPDESRLLTATGGQRSDGTLVILADVTVADSGVLGPWGVWGYALELPSNQTIVLGADGSTILETDGAVSGAVDDRLLVSGFRGSPSLIDPATGAAASVPWIDERSRVLSIATSPTNGALVALQVTDNSFSGLGTGRVRLVDLDDSTGTEAPAWSAPGPSGMAWDPTGSFFVYATQGALAPDSELSIVTVGFVSPDRPPVVAVLGRDQWVQAISVG